MIAVLFSCPFSITWWIVNTSPGIPQKGKPASTAHLSSGPGFWARRQTLVFCCAGFLFGSVGWFSWTISRMWAFTQEEVLPDWDRLFHRCPVSCLQQKTMLAVKKSHHTWLHCEAYSIRSECRTGLEEEDIAAVSQSSISEVRISRERNGIFYCHPLQWNNFPMHYVS